MEVVILEVDNLAADMAIKVLAAETISMEETLVGSISAADMTIFEADITLDITAFGPDGTMAIMVTMVIMAIGFLVTGVRNGILIIEDG